MAKVAFCITCKGRLHHLGLTLAQNLKDNHDARFVLVDYNSQDGLKEWVQSHHNRAISSGRLTVYHMPSAKRFRMAHAKNVSHRCAILEGSDILCNLDADNYTGPDFDRYIADKFSDGNHRFLWARMVQGQLPRGINGRIVVTAPTFLNLGGYDEQFDAWSPDDKDFNLRLCRLEYEAKEIDKRYLDAILHNDKTRFKEYPEARLSQINEDKFDIVSDSDTTVANFGRFGLGEVHRNYDSEPITLAPIPTRLFGIGMHKTATTSLHAALKLLGYDSAHWPSAHWAKAVYEEMVTNGRSRTLERYYAASDLPITLLFKELDRAYPGSKFILTIRDEASWLNSVKNHWSHESNPFRATWSTDPFTHRVHKLLYGTKGFDAEVFLVRYRQHNAEVLEYFKDRPSDLLIMNKPDWNPLCKFLGQSIPSEPYPWKQATARMG